MLFHMCAPQHPTRLYSMILYCFWMVALMFGVWWWSLWSTIKNNDFLFYLSWIDWTNDRPRAFVKTQGRGFRLLHLHIHSIDVLPVTIRTYNPAAIASVKQSTFQMHKTTLKKTTFKDLGLLGARCYSNSGYSAIKTNTFKSPAFFNSL